MTMTIQEIKNYRSGKKISEILHEAADRWLWISGSYHRDDVHKYSCLAILKAVNNDFDCWDDDFSEWKKYNLEFKIICKGLHNMGLRIIDGEGTIFAKCWTLEEAQAARYTWLKWCAMMAEEQGV